MRLTATLVILSALACSVAPLAAEGHDGDGCCHERQAKLLERFDANKDGKLDEGERATAKAALKEHRGEIAGKVLAKHPELDADKDGKLSREEAKAGREQLREHRQAELKEKHPEVFAKLDGNGDGSIDKSEREAARAHYLAKHPEADKNGDGRLERCERKEARQENRDAHGDNGRRAHGDPADNGHDHGRRGNDGQ
jgi:Ca2+-binding EF-hand superfamily protein